MAASETGRTNIPTVAIPSRVIDQRLPISHHAPNHPQGCLVVMDAEFIGSSIAPERQRRGLSAQGTRADSALSRHLG